MVVVHVGDDHVLHSGRINVEHCQSLRWATQKVSSALLGHLFGKTGIHHPNLFLVANHPDEIVQRHGHIMAVTTQEIIGRLAHVVGVFDGINFVIWILAHGISFVE